METARFLCRLIGCVVLTITLLAAVWIYGGVTAFAHFWIGVGVWTAGLCAALTLLLTPKMLRPQSGWRRLAFLTLPLFLALLYGAIQLVPMSEAAMRLASPRIVELGARLLPERGSEEEQFEFGFYSDADKRFAERSFPSLMTVDARRTRQALSVWIIAVLAFVSAGVLLQTPESRRLLAIAVVLNGAVLATILLLRSTVNPWPWYRAIWPGASVGPYVNPNNAAGYLCLCFGASLGLLLASVFRTAQKMRVEGDDSSYVYFVRKSWGRRFADLVFDLLDSLSGPLIFWLFVSGLIFAGVLSTLSRGGTLGASFAFLTVVVLLFGCQKIGRFRLLVLPALFVGLALILWGGMKEPFKTKMATLVDSDVSANAMVTDGRLENWRSAVGTAFDYRLRGSGLGTYSLANRTNDICMKYGNIFEHAENQYVETFVELGALGLVLALSELTLLWLAVFAALRMVRAADRRNRDESFEMAPLFGAAFGMAAVLAGQMTSAFFDFGLTLEANAILLAALTGSFAGTAFESALPDRRTFEPPRFFAAARVFLVAVFIALLCAGAWGIWTVDSERKTDKALRLCALSDDPETLDAKSIDLAIRDLSRATVREPDNVFLRVQLASTHILRYRFVAWEELRRTNPETSFEALWFRTAPESLHRFLVQLTRNGMKVGPKKMRENPALRESMTAAMREILLARRVSPLQPDTHTLFGILLPIVSDTQRYGSWLALTGERAAEVARMEPRIRYETGVLFSLADDTESACRCWKDSLTLSAVYMPSILKTLEQISDLGALDKNIDLALPDDFSLVERTISKYPKKSEPIIFGALLTKMQNILDRSQDRLSGRYFRDRACWNRLAGRFDACRADYETAFEKEPLQASWYYELGSLLLDQKDADAAIELFEKALIYAPYTAVYLDALQRAKELRTERRLTVEPLPKSAAPKIDDLPPFFHK